MKLTCPSLSPTLHAHTDPPPHAFLPPHTPPTHRPLHKAIVKVHCAYHSTPRTLLTSPRARARSPRKTSRTSFHQRSGRHLCTCLQSRRMRTCHLCPRACICCRSRGAYRGCCGGCSNLPPLCSHHALSCFCRRVQRRRRVCSSRRGCRARCVRRWALWSWKTAVGGLEMPRMKKGLLLRMTGVRARQPLWSPLGSPPGQNGPA